MTVTYHKICEWCADEFEAKREHARWCRDECRTEGWTYEQENGPLPAPQRVGEHVLERVRRQQSADEHKRQLGTLIRQAIVNQIRTTGSCFADDLIPLYPEGEVNECRRLATAQFGSLAASRSGEEPLITEIGRRKSSIPDRKGAKSSVWAFTTAGREKWGSPGADREQGQSGQLDSLGGSVCSGASLSGAGGSSSGLKSASGTGRPIASDGEGQVSLLPEPSRMFDVDQQRAA